MFGCFKLWDQSMFGFSIPDLNHFSPFPDLFCLSPNLTLIGTIALTYYNATR